MATTGNINIGLQFWNFDPIMNCSVSPEVMSAFQLSFQDLSTKCHINGRCSKVYEELHPIK
jgi:hypothetical protein